MAVSMVSYLVALVAMVVAMVLHFAERCCCVCSYGFLSCSTWCFGLFKKEFYLVVLVGGVVLEEDDALAVQSPVVLFPLWRREGGRVEGWKGKTRGSWGQPGFTAGSKVEPGSRGEDQ